MGVVDLLGAGVFRIVDLPKLASMTEAGDQAGIQAYFQEISGDHEFSIFFKLDQGSTQHLAGFRSTAGSI